MLFSFTQTVFTTALVTLWVSARGQEWHFTGFNIAQGKNTTQQPGTYENYIPFLAVDGNSDTVLIHGSCAHTSGKYNTAALWTVYLEDTFVLKGIRIYNRDTLRDRHVDFRIIGNPNITILHDDKTADVKLYTKLVIDIPIYVTSAFSEITFEVPARTGSLDSGKSYVTLCEVQLYSVANDCHMPSPPDVLTWTVRHETGHLNSNYSLVSSGSVIEFTCGKDYILTGNSNITCQSDGTYSSEIPQCKEHVCDHPVDIVNGLYLPPTRSKYSVGDVISWKCFEGYVSSEDQTRECLPDLSWGGPTPHCRPITCALPEMLPHLIFDFGSTSNKPAVVVVGTTVPVLCEPGFAPTVPNITCTSAGQWNILPKCIDVECSSIAKVSGEVYLYNNPVNTGKNTYPYGTMAIALCNETESPYSVGQEAHICGNDGLWSGPDIVCSNNEEGLTGQNCSEVCPVSQAALGGSVAGAVLGGIGIGCLLMFIFTQRKIGHTTHKPSNANTMYNIPVREQNQDDHEYSDLSMTNI